MMSIGLVMILITYESIHTNTNTPYTPVKPKDPTTCEVKKTVEFQYGNVISLCR